MQQEYFLLSFKIRLVISKKYIYFFSSWIPSDLNTNKKARDDLRTDQTDYGKEKLTSKPLKSTFHVKLSDSLIFRQYRQLI